MDQPGSTGEGTAGRDRSPAEQSANNSSEDGEAAAPPATRIRFQEVTSESGVSFVYQNGEAAGHFAILESLGGGVGVIDFDRDGADDLFLPGGGTLDENVVPHGVPNGVFRNRGDWRFDDVSDVSGAMDCEMYSHGAACADFDNDGFADVVVTGYGGLQFHRNLGDGTFQEVAQRHGLIDDLWSSSAAWGDVNRDGILDLYVAHYVDWSPDHHPFCAGPEEGKREVCPPREFAPLPDTLFLGQPDGTFQRSSQVLGETGKGLGVVIADFNADQQADIYVTNDTVPNLLYENTGAGNLSDVSLISGTSLSDRGVPDGSMGVHVLDFDNNGHFDLWVANYERESSALYQGHPDLLFRHVSQRTGVTAVGAAYVGWGTVCFDADHDGDEDAFISNGHVIRYPRSAPLRQTPLVFENQDGSRFENVAEAAGDYTASPHMGRGAAFSDLDQDGDLDLIVNHTNEPVALLRNDSTSGHFLQMQLIGRTSPRDAVTAVVTVSVGERTIRRQWIGGGSYASTLSGQLHFGLGHASNSDSNTLPAVTLTVDWPSGRQQTFTDVGVDQLVVIHETRPALISLRNQ
ncbi:MAG: hypothetical protein Fues2KO_27850 [Fuerstiella sp.]